MKWLLNIFELKLNISTFRKCVQNFNRLNQEIFKFHIDSLFSCCYSNYEIILSLFTQLNVIEHKAAVQIVFCTVQVKFCTSILRICLLLNRKLQKKRKSNWIEHVVYVFVSLTIIIWLVCVCSLWAKKKTERNVYESSERERKLHMLLCKYHILNCVAKTLNRIRKKRRKKRQKRTK